MTLKFSRAKKALFVLAAFGILSPTPNSLAGEASDVQWTIQVDPLTTALGYVHVQVERAVSEHFSVYAGPHIRAFDSLLDESEEPFIGVGVEVGGRWFPWHSAPEGVWFGARGVMARLSLNDKSESEFGGYASVLAGGTLIIHNRWVLSGGAGVQYLDYAIADYGVNTWFPALHTAVGVAF